MDNKSEQNALYFFLNGLIRRKHNVSNLCYKMTSVSQTLALCVLCFCFLFIQLFQKVSSSSFFALPKLIQCCLLIFFHPTKYNLLLLVLMKAAFLLFPSFIYAWALSSTCGRHGFRCSIVFVFPFILDLETFTLMGNRLKNPITPWRLARGSHSSSLNPHRNNITIVEFLFR